jgi:type IV secretory pathway VirB2 component (pilin)
MAAAAGIGAADDRFFDAMGKRGRSVGSTRRFDPWIEPVESRLLFAGDLPIPVPTAVPPASAWSAPMQATVGAADTAFAGAPARELVVIDARVAGADLLRADLDARRAGGVAIDVLDVAGDEDGIASIRRALSDGTRYGAVHVFAHGEPGELLVGATAIDLRSLRARAGDFSAWSAGLTDSADLLF